MKIQSFHVGRGELPEHPIEPSYIEGGTPLARAITLTESPDKRLSSGIWECTAGKIRVSSGLHELVQIIDGEVTVREELGDRTLTLRAGDVAYFPLGVVTHWTIPRFVRKMFVLHSSPGREGLIARARRRIATWGVAAASLARR